MNINDPVVPPAATPAAPTRAGREQVENLLRYLGQALNSMSIFGTEHKATLMALDDGFAALNQITKLQPSVMLGADNIRLICDEHIIEPNTALLRTLLRRWNALALGTLELTQGMSREEFKRLIVLLGTATGETAASQAFSQAPAQNGFTHLHFKRMSYQAVSEDDVVMKKQAAAQEAAPAPKKKPASTLSSEIVAYLQSPTAQPLTPSAEATELAAQPAKLAELLLSSADIRPETAQVAGGEQLGSLVVGCLRRLNSHLTTAPAAKTKQGKQAIRQTLIMMEKEVIEKLRSIASANAAAEAASAIEEAVGEMVGDVRMDTLVEDYAKKRQQIEASEKRLLRLLKAQQNDPERAAELEKLQQKLADSGLKVGDWEDLLQKSATPGGTAGGIPGDVPPLNLLLLRLTELLNPATPPQSSAPLQVQLEPIVSQLNTGMASAIAGVEQKMGKLREKIKTMASLPETSAPQAVQDQALSRRKIIAILAEIVQELRQPLAVISGAIESLSGGHLGTVPDLQHEMLQLALQSSRRVAVIVDALADISGQPTSLQPDAEILKRIYTE